jgi:hypothetical protein
VRKIVLYTRDGCSLCVKARAVILAVRREREFAFSETDIGSAGDLYDEHRYDIPVVEIDGRRSFKYRVLPEELERRLRTAQARRAPAAQGEGASSGL